MSESSPTRYRLMPPGNPFAAWAVVCGVAGFCTGGIGGLAAIVLGVLGLIRANKTLEGRGTAVAGIVLGVLAVASNVVAYYGYLGCRHVIDSAH